MEEQRQQLDQAREKLALVKTKLGLDKKQAKIKELQSESQLPNFWQNEPRARRVMQTIADFEAELAAVSTLEDLINDAQTAQELDMAPELQQKLEEISNLEAQLETQVYLSGVYDRGDVILAVHSGQGGIEAMDWAQMLLRMYQRYCDKKGWHWELINQQAGEEAGIKSATLIVQGKYAYGLLKGEKGTHRLVRQSPFNADHLRQTSFALVEVMPFLAAEAEIQLKPQEIEFEAFRSSGHGGQNVNKVSTAVRLRHIRSGIVVESQSQRHQEQNRKVAMQLLRAKLWEIEEQKRQEKLSAIKGKHSPAAWGTQIRSYVLHPYKQVKDLRTQVEVHDPQAVLDGNLDLFIDQQLRQLS